MTRRGFHGSDVDMNPDETDRTSGERTGETGPASEPAVDPRNLTPEEQMERYEQELKETDWGHQPC